MSPRVSIIVPCYNEEHTVGLLLNALRQQEFPLEELEVIIADGLSTDGTRNVIGRYKTTYPELSVILIDNPEQTIPAALNRAIDRAQGDYILRLDAHSVPRPNYVSMCLDILERTDAANVGGAWEIRASQNHWLSRSIAAAAAHPLGAGDARYRYSGAAGEVDTVPFGAFQKKWIERIGGFNESLLTNEDYEFNYRLRRAGGKIWFDPSIRSIYFARPDIASLGRQYLRYGYWKAAMLVNNPQSLRWRQALPALFVSGLLGLLILGTLLPGARLVLAFYWLLYMSITVGFALREAIRKREPGLLLGFPLALWTMHLAWGLAFIWGIPSRLFRRVRGRI